MPWQTTSAHAHSCRWNMFYRRISSLKMLYFFPLETSTLSSLSRIGISFTDLQIESGCRNSSQYQRKLMFFLSPTYNFLPHKDWRHCSATRLLNGVLTWFILLRELHWMLCQRYVRQAKHERVTKLPFTRAAWTIERRVQGNSSKWGYCTVLIKFSGNRDITWCHYCTRSL